jgi:PLP dependent protein
MNGDLTLPQRHAQVLERIGESCATHGRGRDSVALVAVSKTRPVQDVLTLAALGQHAFGENYLQEALSKISQIRALHPELALQWHFIGPIQSNKTRGIAENFDWVHSVDREQIARRLSEQRPADLEPLSVCVQVNVSGEASKQGCPPDQTLALARTVASLPGLRLRGLMTLPEPTPDVAIQRERFSALRALARACAAQGLEMDTLSMGMSDDLDAAIAEGSTMVRVGSALFGRRPVRSTP